MVSDPLLCIVEIPKGSRNKYEWEPELGLMLLDRFLSASVVFPTDYGFIRGAYSSAGRRCRGARTPIRGGSSCG